jgi:hypothetical protein
MRWRLRRLAIRVPTCIAAAKASPKPSPKREACQPFTRSYLPARSACRRSWLHATHALPACHTIPTCLPSESPGCSPHLTLELLGGLRIPEVF